MKTKPKKKVHITKAMVKKAVAATHQLYELYRTKSGTWKFRKRAANGEILNHSYNSRKLAIEGAKTDFELTKNLTTFTFKEIK